MSESTSQHSSFAALKNLVRGAWEATSGERPRLFTFIVLFVVAYSVDLLVPWAIGYTLGVAIEHGFTEEGMHGVYVGLGLYIGFRLLYNLCHHLGRYLQQTVAFEGRMNTLERIFATLLLFPLSWHVRHHSGESLSRLHRSAGAIDTTIGTYVWQIIEGLVKVVFASVAIFALDFWVAADVSVVALISIVFMVFFNRRFVASIRFNNAYFDRINRICVDFLYNVITVKSLNLERMSYNYLSQQRSEGRKINRHIMALNELKWGSIGVGYTIMIGSSLLIYFTRHQSLAGAFDVAQVYVLLNYLDRIFQALGSFTAYYSGMLESATAYEDATSVVDEAKKLPLATSHRGIPSAWNSLEISDLAFSYAGEGGEGIEALQLTIKRGDKIALVGPSGGGKSTLLKILGGLLIPQRYQFRLDCVSSISREDVAQSVLIIPQEPEIFSESVRFNLSMEEEFSPQEVSFFTSLCKVQDVISRLPQGLDSMLSERGMNLSVGEKQRLAFARGLMRARDREIILLDEPTSSLDPMTEKQIFYALLHHFSSRTIITACHRLALVPLFDRVIYIRHGRVEEAGTFAELLERKGAFYMAWKDYEEKVIRSGGIEKVA
ncbi:MAG: ABC transporter ATP-binding protein/permease [Oligoflexia bacterium]|nr:ABC transporter ATP-binding protein/permease [Oligoflexia bacterium]